MTNVFVSNMTSETDALKTNEFLRRRKLRLQQVREQSKDIAKKIRQRAKLEKLKQSVDLDSKKEQIYLQQQEKLVKRLEQLYAQGVKNVGASHSKASEVRQNEVSPQKEDLSKLRGKEAVAELRKKRQEKLDEQKKLLDRKLLAREAANLKSREKSSSVANKLISKSTSKITEESEKPAELIIETDKNCSNANIASNVNKNDMATQWEIEEMPSEWEQNVPSLSLPKDDKESAKDSNNAESKSEKSKRLDLFALSSEMPSSLRGGLTIEREERGPVRPSLTMVSEYLQSRALRLRETSTASTSKKHTDDLNRLKQTILHTRSSKIEATTDKSTILSSENGSALPKNNVTMYNHSTRDSRAIPSGDSGLVVRDLHTNEDAYSQALKEASNDNSKDTKHQDKMRDMRSKVAMTKQTVEKEYNETMSFLKSLPKDKCSKHMSNAYKDEQRQQLLKDRRQQKLQQEFRRIEKEHRKSCSMNQKCCQNSSENSNNKSKSPIKCDDDEFNDRDVQYSWMPVPESDGNLAIHTIPTALKEGKAHSVKFSKVDSYHEYRSRHKHTPPTKDPGDDRPPKRVVETVLIENDIESDTSVSSDTSSVENLNIGKKNKSQTPENTLSEAEKIIIYKILDSKAGKKSKDRKSRKLISDLTKVLNSIDKDKLNDLVKDKNNNRDGEGGHKTSEIVKNNVPIDQISEGVYKVVSEKEDNVRSAFSSKTPPEGSQFTLAEDEIKYGRPCTCGKKDGGSQKIDNGTNIKCGGGDKIGNRSLNCHSCKCGCSSNSKSPDAMNTSVQPSATTSTSSFKTATNVIKLLEKDSQDAGKFYVGASGFLKDEAYEVVIQLRKKECSQKDNDKESVKASEKLRDKNMQEVKEPDDLSAKSSEVILIEPAKQINEQKANESVQSLEPEKVTVKDSKLQTEEKEINFDKPDAGPIPAAKDFVDKEVYTNSQYSFTVPINNAVSEPEPRPATSTYTQTTNNSPNQRPVFIHMSSSTSTAYMSPPDMILPSFFKREHQPLHSRQRYVNSHDESCVRTDDEEYKNCRCKRCLYISTITREMYINEKNCNKNLYTPPNTARNTDNKDEFENDIDFITHKSNKICRKCEKHGHAHTNIKGHTHKKKHKRIPSNNLVMRVNSNAASTFRSKTSQLSSNPKNVNSKLNPIVKKYVNRLLQLNREGLRAIEVANQECSSVSTPGSSIIDVPGNIKKHVTCARNTISLEQMKGVLKKQILDEFTQQCGNKYHDKLNLQQILNTNTKKSKTSLVKLPKNRSVHKVKSLNISKRLKTCKSSKKQQCSRNLKSSTSSPTSINNRNERHTVNYESGKRSLSSPTPRQVVYSETRKDASSDTSGYQDIQRNSKTSSSSNTRLNQRVKSHVYNKQKLINKPNNDIEFKVPIHRAAATSDSDEYSKFRNRDLPLNTSTQTSQDLDSEINFVKRAEDKLQNMEKIADLTEKCTKRLSSLAKVLEQVRKNKSMAYSQISTPDTAHSSDSDNKSDKNADVEVYSQQLTIPVVEIHEKKKKEDSTSPIPAEEIIKNSAFVPFLNDIPKPADFKYPTQQISSVTETSQVLKSSNNDQVHSKNKKPPPALARIHLKHAQDIVPHELSTVLEVDSPMSLKLKSRASRSNPKFEILDTSNHNHDDNKKQEFPSESSIKNEDVVNPDLLQSNVTLSKRPKKSSTDSSEDSRIQMMDLKQFNELMLKPFISLQEYAKQCDVAVLDEGSNLDDNAKDELINDELSSLHSDGSLPDVIAELLKRNVIAEPFKFDSLSNVNSTTVSSDSTLSVLALSKIKTGKKKSSVMFQNKDTSETSDTFSISSNPDLENAFKKMGMGWASSTLKKTKERLALSSSSNTSSSSLNHLKVRNGNNQDVPAIVTDSVVSDSKRSKNGKQDKTLANVSKNVEQQTSFRNSMTVKEFLTNELAKKITFSSKSKRNDTDDEFVSLLETKMPDEMKHSSQNICEEGTADSLQSGDRNRARTSTPVQIFKSMIYHSSSSSNLSNGLFSNADDLSSVKVTSNSIRNHSTSEKDELTIPNCSLKTKKCASDSSKSD